MNLKLSTNPWLRAEASNATALLSGQDDSGGKSLRHDEPRSGGLYRVLPNPESQLVNLTNF